MPRDHTRINLDIWGDDDWLDLSAGAQHLYFVLCTWPSSLCGGGDWQPRKVAARAKGWTVPDVLDAAEELVAGEFTLIDLDTEEYLLRSWIKHDGLYRVQNMAVSVANARAALASRTLRGVVVHEVSKLRASEPTLESWKKDAVVKMLDQKAIDPSTVEWSSPWDSSSASSWASGKASPKDSPQTSSSDSSRATPTNAPTPNSCSAKEEESTRKRATRLSKDYMPSKLVIDAMKAECPNVDFEAEHRKFIDYYLGTGKPMKDWDATWRNWIRRAGERTNSSTAPSGNVHKLRGLAELAAEQRIAEQNQDPTRKELA